MRRVVLAATACAILTSTAMAQSINADSTDAQVQAWAQRVLKVEGWDVRVWNDEAVFLLAPDEIEFSQDGNPRLWVRVEYISADDGVLSSRVLTEFDCSDGRSRTLSGDDYSERNLGGEVTRHDDAIAGWELPGTSTPNAVLHAEVCEYSERLLRKAAAEPRPSGVKGRLPD